jgi:hypothetical protein
VQYQINRNNQGWVIELINDRGVTKKGDAPVVIDTSVATNISLTSRVDVLYAYNWKTGAVMFPTGSSWGLTLGPGDIQYVQFVTPLDADFNRDGYVNGLDLTIWRTGFGTANGATRANGDADGDGDVDGYDFQRWQQLEGQFIPTPTAVAVPELPSFALWLVGWLTALCVRRASQSSSPAPISAA